VLHRETIAGVSDRLHLRFFCEGGTHFAMAQLFPKSANVHARVVIVGIVVLACGAGWATSSPPRNGEHQLFFPLKTRKRKKSDGNNMIAPATSA
jgi:hypothetical protein